MSSRIVVGDIYTRGHDRQKDLQEFEIRINAYTTNIVAASQFCDDVRKAVLKLADEKTYGDKSK